MASEASVQKASVAIMQVLTDLYSLRTKKVSLHLVAKRAGYSGIQGKAFRTAVKQFKDAGLIAKLPKDEIELTEFGIAKMPKTKGPPPSNKELQDSIFDDIMKEPKGLPKRDSARKIFDRLLDGTSHKKDALAKLGGYAGADSKPFRNLIKRMEGFLEGGGSAGVKFSDFLFPLGRPDSHLEPSSTKETAKTPTITPMKRKANDNDETKQEEEETEANDASAKDDTTNEQVAVDHSEKEAAKKEDGDDDSDYTEEEDDDSDYDE